MVTNVNVPPLFTNTPFDVSISEGTAPDTIIKTITAEDVDEDTIQFTISTVGIPFEINQFTGEIKTTGILDRETTSSYTITVNVNDGQASVGTTFTITITDVNDNAPLFTESIYEIELPEDTTINQGVLTVEAQDKDQGSNKQIMYSISGGNDDEKFALNMVCQIY